nr:TlpA disulfide reductase family protein [Pedobacter sp. ASV19]
MKFKFVAIAATGLFCVGQVSAQNNNYVIKGTIKGASSGRVYLEHENENKKVVTDSTVLSSEGNFQFKGKVVSPQFYSIKMKGIKNPSTFLLENAAITFAGSKDSLNKAVITGSESQNVYLGFYNGPWKAITKKAGDIYQRLDKAEQGGKVKPDSLTRAGFDREFRVLDTLNQAAVKDYVSQHPGSVGSAAIIYDRFIAYPNFPVARSLFSILSPKVQKSLIGQQITHAFALDEKTATGQIAPAIAMADKDGKIVHLSDFKGKYVMVDFWASWCGPCRKENPNVVAAYKKYHDKGFEVLGVSLDSNKESWLKAIAADGLTWTHVSDLKGWANAAAAEYGVKAVPASFLIGPDGKVVGKDLRGEALNKKLGELMK